MYLANCQGEGETRWKQREQDEKGKNHRRERSGTVNFTIL